MVIRSASLGRAMLVVLIANKQPALSDRLRPKAQEELSTSRRSSSAMCLFSTRAEPSAATQLGRAGRDDSVAASARNYSRYLRGAAQTREARIQWIGADGVFAEPADARRATTWTAREAHWREGRRRKSARQQDKRQNRLQIDRLQRELETVRRARATQAQGSQRARGADAAIVGYTNVGKSQLPPARLTRTGADVFIEDSSSQRLDNTREKLRCRTSRPLLLPATRVGFVRQRFAPTRGAFNATLEEATIADFLIMCASFPARGDEIYNTTMSVLGRARRDTKQMLVVFNKVDKVVASFRDLFALRRHFPEPRFGVSRLSARGMDELVERISEFVARGSMTVELRLPPAREPICWPGCIARERSAEAHYESRLCTSRGGHDSDSFL